MKVAILVDGGFYRKRVQKVFGDETPEIAAERLYKY
ncbi:TPA: NYN domain-containing protein, partial [Streptococcus suis]|nr:NYN domain-containing protein [Streptococcus suis]